MLSPRRALDEAPSQAAEFSGCAVSTSSDDEDEKKTRVAIASSPSRAFSTASFSLSAPQQYEAALPSDDADDDLKSTSPLSPRSSHPYAAMPPPPDDCRPMCRVCLESDRVSDLIVPCLCSGSSLWIHRRCLDGWRALNFRRPAFYQCDTCHFYFEYERPLHRPSATRTLACRLLVVRDLIGLFLLVQLWLVALAAVIGGCDYGFGHHLSSAASINPLALFYLFSIVLSFALFGVFGTVASCVGLQERLMGPRGTSRCAGDCCASDGGNCDACSDQCGCGAGAAAGEGGAGGAGDDECCGVFWLLQLLALALVGVVYGFVYGGGLVRRVVGRHMQRGWHRPAVEKFRVADWKDRRDKLKRSRLPTQRMSMPV